MTASSSLYAADRIQHQAADDQAHAHHVERLVVAVGHVVQPACSYTRPPTQQHIPTAPFQADTELVEQTNALSVISGTGFHRSNDPINSVTALKDDGS